MKMETISPSEVTAHLVRNALRRKWPIIVVTMVLLAALGAFAGGRLVAGYTSTTAVLLKATTGNVLSPDAAKSSQQITVAMTTEAQLVISPQVTDLVNAKLGTTIPPSSNLVAVTVPASTQILQIAVTADSAADAQKRSEAFGEAFLKYRQSQTKTLVDQQVKDLDAQAKTASDELKKAEADANVPQPSADAVARLQLYSNRLATVQDASATLKSTSNDPGTVIAPAILPDSASGLPSWVFPLAGALLGLGLGVVIALWRERADDRIRFASVATVAGLPVLASLVGSEPADEESLRQLRASVVRLSPAPSVLAVVPVSDGVSNELVTLTGTGLARALARSGYRTALVDATMHDSPDSGPGLSDWLLDPKAGALSQAIETSAADDADGVDRISGGGSCASARDLLAGQRFADGVHGLATDHDYVVLVGTSPSTGSGADLALVADHGIVVGRENSTTHEQVGELLERTGRTGPALLGLVSTRGAVSGHRPGGRTRKADHVGGSHAVGHEAGGADPTSGSRGGAKGRPGERAQAKRAHQSTDRSGSDAAEPSGASYDDGAVVQHQADAEQTPRQSVL